MTPDELRHQVQAAIFTAADTVHVWRDGAIAILALVVIACLWFMATVYGWGDGG